MTSELGKILIENDFEAWGGKELPVAIESGLLEPFKEAAELSAKRFSARRLHLKHSRCQSST
ncbi:hypothetical protein PO124_23040 [Bacillus licheniformis]|nr:hypothetical protein [Bacillus licheniformis]